MRCFRFLPFLAAGCLGLCGIFPCGRAADAATAGTPGEVVGLALWLDAAALMPGLRDGEAVARWPDRSGNGYDAVFEPTIPQVKFPARPNGTVPQEKLAVGHHQAPTLKAAAWGSRPAVAFDATRRQTLVLNVAGHALGQDAPGFTIALAVRAARDYGPAPVPDVEWSPHRYFFISHLSDYSTRFAIKLDTRTGAVSASVRLRPGQSLTTWPAPVAAQQLFLRGGAWHRLIVAADYRRKRLRLRLDGMPAEGALPAARELTTEDVPSPITGFASNTLGEWLSCDLAEVLAFERGLDAAELARIDAYLRAKYHAAD